MDPLSRSETLQVLSDMGINLPQNTKLKDTVVEKRVRDALAASQNRDNIATTLNPATMPAWPIKKPWNGASGEGGRSIFDAVRRTSYQEMAEHHMAQRAGREYNPVSLYSNAFWDLRQTIMSIGNALDNGARWCMIQDPKCEKYAINIRVRVS